jgi:hypothetical protein
MTEKSKRLGNAKRIVQTARCFMTNYHGSSLLE